MKKKELMLRLVEHEMMIDDLDERITILEEKLKKSRKKNVK